jgi:hypothetical protein
MRLHTTVIEKLVRLYETYGGHRNESKLKSMLQEIDLSEYERQSGEKILVMTGDLNDAKNEQLVCR